MIQTPTSTELAVMAAVRDHERAMPSSPTVEQVATRMSKGDARAVSQIIRVLIARGWLEASGKRRAVQLTYRGALVLAAGAGRDLQAEVRA